MLTEVQRRIVDDLRRDGIAIVAFGDLFDEGLWAELQSDVAPFVRQCEDRVRNDGAKLPPKKYILRRFWSKKGPAHRFPLDDPSLRVFASSAVLEIVNEYRGEWTKLYYLDNWFTVPFAESSERLGSQRWHRDPEDEHVVKAFLYLTDVDEGAGPFEYVRGSSRGGRYGDLWPWADSVDRGDMYPPQDELTAAVDPSDRLSLAGPAGTLILGDTAGFHRGGFSRTKPRVLGLSTYVPSRSLTERRFDVDFDGARVLPPAVRFALE
jgi:hypothetical protein